MSFCPKGLIFESHTLNAFRTGYHNIRETNKQIFGPELVEQISEVHGLDEEGELRGTCRPTGHPGVRGNLTTMIHELIMLQLWFAGGDFYHCRFMSKQMVGDDRNECVSLIDRYIHT